MAGKKTKKNTRKQVKKSVKVVKKTKDEVSEERPESPVEELKQDEAATPPVEDQKPPEESVEESVDTVDEPRGTAPDPIEESEVEDTVDTTTSVEEVVTEDIPNFQLDDGFSALDRYQVEMDPYQRQDPEKVRKNQRLLYSSVLTTLRKSGPSFNDSFSMLLNRFHSHPCYDERYILRGLIDGKGNFPKWLPRLYIVMVTAANPETRKNTSVNVDVTAAVVGMPSEQAERLLQYFG